MGDKEFLVYLSPECEDCLRHLHTMRRGRLVRFCIQYEAWGGDKWTPIVRYDTAHGRPHRDLLHPDGTETKEEFLGYSAADVMMFGERDIRSNWRRYREAYEKEARS